MVAERTRSELERSRPAAHRAERPRRRRRRETARAAEPEWRGRGDQLLERQVPLRLLAALERDHRERWRMGTAATDPDRCAVDGRSSPRRIPSGSPDTTASTQLTSPCCGCSSAMTHRRRLPHHELLPESWGVAGALVLDVLAATRRAHRGTHLGWPPLSERGRGRPVARHERRQLRHRELLPAGWPLTDRQVVRQ